MRASYKVRFCLLALLLLSPLVVACQSQQGTPAVAADTIVDEATVSATGKVLPAHWANLGFALGGPVKEIFVAEGQQVTAGDALACVDLPELDAAVAQTEATLALSRAQLARLESGPREVELRGAEAAVGSIALMNTMIMSVAERTREIGVLRAVGWRRWLVLRQILGEALLLTLLSGMVGVAWTAALVRVLKAIPSLGIWREMFELTPIVVIEALILCVTLGIVGGLYPAWRATRLSPVEALRYE